MLMIVSASLEVCDIVIVSLGLRIRTRETVSDSRSLWVGRPSEEGRAE